MSNHDAHRTDQHETEKLAKLKDRFIRYWPELTYILVDLEARHVEPDDHVLVIGSGRTPKPIVAARITNIDIRPYSHVTSVCDAQRLSFADNTFDRIVCHQVLEHIPATAEVVAEMHRVLKPGGKSIVTVPFYFPFHASPNDYYRFTIPGLRHVFGAFEEIDSGIYIGPMAAALYGLQRFLAMLMPGFYLSYSVQALLAVGLYPLKYLDLLVSRLPRAVHFAASVYYVGKKPVPPFGTSP